MNYVFLDIETTGLDYKTDEIILIECKKYDKNFKKLDELKLYINMDNLKEKLEKLKLFLSNCYVICFDAELNLSFLLTAMYHTKVDMKFWYLELSELFNEKINCNNIKQICELYDINYNVGLYKYVEVTKKYMKDNNISNLDELVKVRANKWNIIFRGINYPEYLGDLGKYTFYIADLSSDKYPSYLTCLKEIRREDFTKEELKELKDNYNVKILAHILKIDEEIIKITNDYYITSYGQEIDPTKKCWSDYIEQLESAAKFIANNDEKVEITCYDTIKELDEKTRLIDKKIMDIIKSKIIREKKKWSRW